MGRVEAERWDIIPKPALPRYTIYSSSLPPSHPWRFMVPLPVWGSAIHVFLHCSISRMRRSVSSPDESSRRELKIRRAAEYFLWTSRCFIWWWNSVSNAWYYFSNKIVVEGATKDAKMSSFSSDFQTLIKHLFPLYFLYELLMSLRRLILPFPAYHLAWYTCSVI